MATTIIKRPLQNSNMGQGISVTATQGGTNNTIHTTFSGTSVVDEIWIYAQNNYSQAVNVCIEFGISQSGMQIITPINPQNGLEPCIQGMLLFGSAGCQTVTAFVNGLGGSASPAISGSSLISIYGYVHRITQT